MSPMHEALLLIYVMSVVCVLAQALAHIMRDKSGVAVTVGEAIVALAAAFCPVLNTAVWLVLMVPSVDDWIICRKK